MVEEYQMLEDLNEIKEDIYMALFGNGNRSNFTFFDESIDDFVINEFDAGANATEDNDDEDDIQGLDDNEVDDEEETPDEPDTQTDDTPEEPVNDNPEDDTDAQEDDGIEGMDDSEVGDDTGEEPTGDTTTDTPTDDTTDPTTDEPDAGGEDTGDDDLDTIDDDTDGMDDMGDGSGDTGEDTGDDLGGDDNGDSLDSDSSENDPHQRLKELEAEIFDQLSEPEKQMKINELKKLYGLLIDKADSLYKLTQEISKTDDTVKMIDYTLNTLMDLKTYMKDYVIDVFDNRTYLQNSVNFQKFLTIFDAVHSIFKEIKKQLEFDDKK